MAGSARAAAVSFNSSHNMSSYKGVKETNGKHYFPCNRTSDCHSVVGNYRTGCFVMPVETTATTKEDKFFCTCRVVSYQKSRHMHPPCAYIPRVLIMPAIG